MTDTIIIRDLEVRYRVGVPDDERASAQRLLLTIEMETDAAIAAAADDLTRTIDYDAVARRLRALGADRSWRLIETLAEEIAAIVLSEFGPRAVTVEVRKFILPETRYVAVRLHRKRCGETAEAVDQG